MYNICFSEIGPLFGILQKYRHFTEKSVKIWNDIYFIATFIFDCRAPNADSPIIRQREFYKVPGETQIQTDREPTV